MAKSKLTRTKLIRWAKAHGACPEGLRAFAKTRGEPIAVLKRWDRNTGPTHDYFWWVRMEATWDSYPTREQRSDLLSWAHYGAPQWDVLERVILDDLARIDARRAA